MSSSVALEMISKRFGQVEACVDVDFRIEQGEIHALLGENGAGKSTLMKVLYGIYAPDSGRILLDGSEVTIRSPNEAMRLGIGMVHQHLSLVSTLKVWENAALGERGRLSRSEIVRRIESLSERYGLGVDPMAEAVDLGIAQQQRLEVLKCLGRDPRVIILDEPTSVLTSEESEELFRVLRSIVASEGRSVVLISHKLDEVLTAADRITVMREGMVVISGIPVAEADVDTLARAIVGDKVDTTVVETHSISRNDDDGTAAVEGGGASPEDIAPPTLQVDGLTASLPRRGEVLRDLDLFVRRGEIVGLAGVDGNGQELLEDVLCGFVPYDSGTIQVAGEPVDPTVPGAMRRAGVAVVASDRHHSGAALNLAVTDNLIVDISSRRRYARLGVVARRQLHAAAAKLIGEYRIKAGGPEVPFWSLSGGNQQRAVFARELLNDTVFVLACQPTKGLDVAAIAEMRARLVDLAREGVGVLLVSTDLDEILELCSRVAVISGGRIIGELSRSEASPERLGTLLGGHARHDQAADRLDPDQEPAPSQATPR